MHQLACLGAAAAAEAAHSAHLSPHPERRGVLGVASYREGVAELQHEAEAAQEEEHRRPHQPTVVARRRSRRRLSFLAPARR